MREPDIVVLGGERSAHTAQMRRRSLQDISPHVCVRYTHTYFYFNSESGSMNNNILRVPILAQGSHCLTSMFQSSCRLCSAYFSMGTPRPLQHGDAPLSCMLSPGPLRWGAALHSRRAHHPRSCPPSAWRAVWGTRDQCLRHRRIQAPMFSNDCE